MNEEDSRIFQSDFFEIQIHQQAIQEQKKQNKITGMTKAWFKCRTLQLPTKMPKNRIKPLRSAVVDMNPRGFNMAVIAENSLGNDSEELFLDNTICESRRRCLNMQIVLNHLVAQRRKVLYACFVLLLLI